MTNFANLQRDSGDLGELVNENKLVATRYGGNKKSWQYLVDQFEAEFAEQLLEINKSRGYRVVGTFAAGFEYELFNDVGIDASGNSWIYVGSGAPVKTVTAGTVPSAPDYQQVTFNSIDGVVGLRDELNDRTLELTLAEAQLMSLNTGQTVTMTDFANAKYNVVSDADTGGYYLTYKAGFKFKLIHSERKVLALFFDLTSSAKIAEMIEYTNINMLYVDWAGVGSLSIDQQLYIETSSPTKFLWKCSDGVVTFNYTGLSAIGNLIRTNNTVSAQVSGVTFNCNNLVANPLHLEKSSAFGGSVAVINYEANDVRQVDPITVSAAGLLVSGNYKAVTYLDVLVDGVHHETAGRSSVGAAVINFGGVAKIDQLNVRNVTTGSGVDADGLSVFGTDVATPTTRLGARVEVTNSTFQDCLGRFIKLQVSDWEVHGCTFILTSGVTTINEFRGLDAQAGGGHFHDCRYIFGSGITWGNNSTLATIQAIRNDGIEDSAHIHDINVSTKTAGLDRLFTYLVQYGENTLNIHNITVNGETVEKGLLFGISGPLSETDKINIQVKSVSVTDYSGQDFFKSSNNIDFGDKLYLEFINNNVRNKASIARLYDQNASFSVGSNFLIANNGHINDRIDWVFNLDELSDGNAFYTGGQAITGAPNGTFAHYFTQAATQYVISSTGTTASRRTTNNDGSSWNAWVSI